MNHDIGINHFIKHPYDAVWNGYNPSYLDCVASCADGVPDALRNFLADLKEFSGAWGMEVGELIQRIILMPLGLIILATSPLLIWPAGFFLQCRLKGYPERRKKKLMESCELIKSATWEGE